MSELVEHKGKVVSVAGQQVKVLIMQASACNGCHAKGSCMAAEAKEKYIDCTSADQLQVGDEVMVSVSQSLAWEAVLLSFVLPFLLLIFMLWLFGMYYEEQVAGTAAIIAVILYYAVLALFRSRLKRQFNFVARKI